MTNRRYRLFHEGKEQTERAWKAHETLRAKMHKEESE